MKKLINAPEDVLVESLKGVALAHPELSVDLENHVITRATPKAQGKVAIVSGGGSGHEPLHGPAGVADQVHEWIAHGLECLSIERDVTALENEARLA